MLTAVTQVRTLLPFPRLRIDTDSGSEFLNAELLAHCEQEHLTFTRGRPAVKNDQCHVEQKNGAVVREAVGCARLVGVQAYQQLREVYQILRLVVNGFQPSLKLQAKVLRGEQMHRVYDAAQTPLQRLLDSGILSEDRQRDLREWVRQIDPLALSERLDALRYALLCGADGRAWHQPAPPWLFARPFPCQYPRKNLSGQVAARRLRAARRSGTGLLSTQPLRPLRCFFMDPALFIRPEVRPVKSLASRMHPGRSRGARPS